jgi:hypothetical protein
MVAIPRRYLMIALFFLIISCKQDNKTPEGHSQMEKVMAIHDEVMPQMGVMGKLVGELKKKEDTTAIGQEYKRAREALQAANKSMMVWMQEFGNRFDSDEILNGKELNDQKQQWLNEEEQKVQALKDEILTSIGKAKALLKDTN